MAIFSCRPQVSDAAIHVSLLTGVRPGPAVLYARRITSKATNTAPGPVPDNRQPPLDEPTPSVCADCRSTLELIPVEIGRPTSHISVVASLIEQGRFTTGKNRSVVVFRALLDLDLVIKLQDGDRSAPESALCRLDTAAREVFT